MSVTRSLASESQSPKAVLSSSATNLSSDCPHSETEVETALQIFPNGLVHGMVDILKQETQELAISRV